VGKAKHERRKDVSIGRHADAGACRWKLACFMAIVGSVIGTAVTSIVLVVLKPRSALSPVAMNADISPTTFGTLLTMPRDELAKMDVAFINLLCAQGLPGTENRAITQSRGWLAAE
jgi:hypothetical protein